MKTSIVSNITILGVLLSNHSLLVSARLRYHEDNNIINNINHHDYYDHRELQVPTCDLISFGIGCHQDDPGGWCRCVGGDGSIAKNKGNNHCYDSFLEDCDCLSGYQLTPDGCVSCNFDRRNRWCREEGGDGAVAKPGQRCYDNFEDDCTCEKGYRMSDDRDECEYCDHTDRDLWCREEGGEGAFARQDENCNDGFEQHCDCRNGYLKTEDECEFCNRGNEDAWCRSFDEHGGGLGAYARPGFSCYYDFEDHCSCQDGYIKNDDGCEYNCHDDDPNDWCKSIGGPGAYGREDIGDCWDNFGLHCGCFDGWDQTETGCVRSSDSTSRNDLNKVRYVGDNDIPEYVYPLRRCEGDCDSDSDCQGDLECFQRSSGYIPVPGCRGGDTDPSDKDYCYDPTGSSQPREAPSNTTYTIYKFFQDQASPLEAGCSYIQNGVVAACQDAQITLVETSLSSISCEDREQYWDGSSRIKCDNTCDDNVCDGVLLATTRLGDSLGRFQLGEVTFRCESSTKTSEFVCGPNGISTERNSETDTILHSVQEKKDFRWGLFFGPYHCLGSFGGVSFTLGRSVSNAWNPDLSLP